MKLEEPIVCAECNQPITDRAFYMALPEYKFGEKGTPTFYHFKCEDKPIYPYVEHIPYHIPEAPPEILDWIRITLITNDNR